MFVFGQCRGNQTVNDPLISEKDTRLNSKNKLDWDYLRYFVAVIKAGTVIGAGSRSI